MNNRIFWWAIIYISSLWNLYCVSLNNVFACPIECICVSQTQALCNTGGLHTIPTNLPITIEDIQLKKNNFTIIKSDAFAGMRALKKISLDENSIVTIKPFAFRGLPKLQIISIQNTPLATVAQFAFAGLQNITSIVLSHNQIVTVEMNAFAGTSNVRYIILTYNPMLRIEQSAFSGLTNVELIALPSGIRTIETDAFYGMTGVGHIKLAYMDLTELSPHTFRGLSHVHNLFLQESDLGVICENAFDGLTNVGTLKFINNKIDSIDQLNITVDHNVRSLIFQGNHILKIPEPGAIILDGIRNLSIINNHFPCGCNTQQLLDSPLANTDDTIDKAELHRDFLLKNYCISPLENYGRPMIEFELLPIGRCTDISVTRDNWMASSAIGQIIRHNGQLMLNYNINKCKKFLQIIKCPYSRNYLSATISHIKCLDLLRIPLNIVNYVKQFNYSLIIFAQILLLLFNFKCFVCR